MQLSPDGRRVAVALSRLPRGGKGSSRWLEVLETSGGGRVFTSQGLGIVDNFAWLGDSRRFAFTREEKGLTDICLYDLDGHAVKTLVAGIANFTSCWWADDGSFGVYAVGEEADADKAYRHVRNLDDRFRTPEPRQALTLFFAASGARQPWPGSPTTFPRCASAPTTACCCWPRTARTPRSALSTATPWCSIHLADGRREKILDDPWIEDFAWSPDSGKLLLLGGASAFSGLGSTLPAGTVPNDFDMPGLCLRPEDEKGRSIEPQVRPVHRLGLLAPERQHVPESDRPGLRAPLPLFAR